MKILLLYTSYEGQTEKIMNFISGIVVDQIFSCDIIKLVPNTFIDVEKYNAIIIGSSVRYGSYHKKIKRFICKNQIALSRLYSAFLGVNMVARKANKNTPENNIYTRKFLSSLPWQPQMKAVFAGALYYPRYNWFDKRIIRLIMWFGNGSTDIRKPVIEYTDWRKVEEFAKEFKQNCLKIL